MRLLIAILLTLCLSAAHADNVPDACADFLSEAAPVATALAAQDNASAQKLHDAIADIRSKTAEQTPDPSALAQHCTQLRDDLLYPALVSLGPTMPDGIKPLPDICRAHLATLRILVDHAGNDSQRQRLEAKSDDLLKFWTVMQTAKRKIAKAPADKQQMLREQIARDEAEVAQSCADSAAQTHRLFKQTMSVSHE